VVPPRRPSGFLWTVRILTSLTSVFVSFKFDLNHVFLFDPAFAAHLRLGPRCGELVARFRVLSSPRSWCLALKLWAQPWLCGSMGQSSRAIPQQYRPSSAVHYGSASGPVASIWRPTASTPVFRSGNLNLYSSLPNVLRLQHIARQIFSHYPMPPSGASHDDVGQGPVKIGFL